MCGGSVGWFVDNAVVGVGIGGVEVVIGEMIAVPLCGGDVSLYGGVVDLRGCSVEFQGVGPRDQLIISSVGHGVGAAVLDQRTLCVINRQIVRNLIVVSIVQSNYRAGEINLLCVGMEESEK